MIGGSRITEKGEWNYESKKAIKNSNYAEYLGSFVQFTYYPSQKCRIILSYFD